MNSDTTRRRACIPLMNYPYNGVQKMDNAASVFIAPLRLIEREGFFLLDLFHRERKPAVFEELLDLLEGLDIKNDPDLPVVVGYDVLPVDIDHRSSPPAALSPVRVSWWN